MIREHDIWYQLEAYDEVARKWVPVDKGDAPDTRTAEALEYFFRLGNPNVAKTRTRKMRGTNDG